MNRQITLEEGDIDVPEFEDTADQVTGDAYSVERPVRPTISPGRASAWFFQAERQLQAIERLCGGWDSQGGAAPDRQTLRSGARLLSVLASADADLAQPHMHPTRSGGIQFHWESGPRYFEIDVLDPYTCQRNPQAPTRI